ncbi:MAG: AraC family transcriptional regulator, activator of mtrCDE [Bradyrhizobium sp.]|nr:AraC family transcriptional regulator, activator of mtrCDE [Bradyrhizobium sp.]
MADEPLWRISRHDLDKLMVTLEVGFVRLSECIVMEGAQLTLARGVDCTTILYTMTGSGWIISGAEDPIRASPHTLIVFPPGDAVTVAAADAHDRFSPPAVKEATPFAPGSAARHTAGTAAPAITLACGVFKAVYGAHFDLFSTLTAPVVETFDAHDQLDQVISYALRELTAQDVGGGAMARALFKLVLLAFLRRSMVSADPWVERLAVLSDPPIARAFAVMSAQPAAAHTVHSLAQAVGLSRSSFMARFAAALGESPMALLRRLRMRVAANLLAADALSIDQVALQSGYQSRSSFSRSFRKFYGSDPSEYRNAASRETGMFTEASGPQETE